MPDPSRPTSTQRSSLPKASSARTVHLTLYPGEITLSFTTLGHIYVEVEDRLIKAYEACAGPPPGLERAGGGGHTAESTPAGEYIVGSPRRHITPNWPMSVVPWGARLRLGADQEIEYAPDGKTWMRATGMDGSVTRAAILYLERTRRTEARNLGRPPVTISDNERRQINAESRGAFFEDGKLLESWNRNDFGPWAWNLNRRDGRGKLEATPYFVHTTPNDEAATAAGRDFQLTNSHGCIHIRPRDRDEMMAHGYLQRGVRFSVRQYGLKGPAIVV